MLHDSVQQHVVQNPRPEWPVPRIVRRFVESSLRKLADGCDELFVRTLQPQQGVGPALS